MATGTLSRTRGKGAPRVGNPMVAYEQALLADIELLRKRAARGETVRAVDVTALLVRYGTSFELLPRYLQAAVDRIELTD